MGKHLILSLLIFLAGFWVVNALEEKGLERFTFQEPHMGTQFRLVLYAKDKATAEKVARAAFARVAELNRIMSDYLEDSELMQLCKKAGGEPVEVSKDLFQVLQEADRISKLSGGAFDVSIAPVVKLWRKARRTGKLPETEELKKALALVDYRQIKLHPEGRRVQLMLVGMLLDLGGIGKGYAADAFLEVLRQHGIRSALVAAGGDITVSEAPPDAKGWKVGIAPLEPGGGPSKYLLLRNAAVSTSGDLFQFVEIGGKRYSHIVDPKTGLGLLGRRSVTVIAPRGASADGLDTALCILGPQRGLQVVESLDHVAALFMLETDKGVTVVPSKRFGEHEVKE
jgi:thiamine biosynthesis lipoprotein